jgi:hypothetical protein
MKEQLMFPLRATLVVLPLVCLLSQADEKVKPERPLRVSLMAKTKSVKAGEKPVFSLTIENRGTHPERLRNAHMPRLQATWYGLAISQEGKPVDLPQKLIGVPLPMERDMITLKPGEKVEFELTRFCASVETLPPGKYAGQIQFATWPEKGDAVHYDSPTAEFVVEK